VLFPTPDLVARLVRAERAVVVDWLGAMAGLPGNPLGAEVIEVGSATACVCAGIPAEIWNRVFGLTEAERERIPAIARVYHERGAAPLFDLAPHGVKPFWEGPNMLSALAESGFYQAAFHQLLYGRPEPGPAPEAAGVEVREVGPEAADEFSRVYETVWGGAAAIRVLLGHPRFRCYLAYVGGEPAALGVLHVHEGAASMANGLTDPRFRNRGCQTALLHRRITDAAALGCDVVVSQCRPGSQSERNQLRAGFAIAGTKVWWAERR
jgi:GNAT superfamily N-acetyltransferase